MITLIRHRISQAVFQFDGDKGTLFRTGGGSGSNRGRTYGGNCSGPFRRLGAFSHGFSRGFLALLRLPFEGLERPGATIDHHHGSAVNIHRPRLGLDLHHPPLQQQLLPCTDIDLTGAEDIEARRSASLLKVDSLAVRIEHIHNDCLFATGDLPFEHKLVFDLETNDFGTILTGSESDLIAGWSLQPLGLVGIIKIALAFIFANGSHNDSITIPFPKKLHEYPLPDFGQAEQPRSA